LKPGTRSQDPEVLAASGDHLQAGRLLESRQRVTEALDAYERGGAFTEAARLLGAQGRFRDAGIMLMRTLPETPTPVERLSQAARRDALGAAMWFARAGSRAEAVGILVALGENQRAASLLSMAGRREDAARAMRGEPVPGSPWAQGVLHSLPVGRPAPAPAVTPPPKPVPPRPAVPQVSNPGLQPAPAQARAASVPARKLLPSEPDLPPYEAPPSRPPSADPARSQARLRAIVPPPDALQPGGELWPVLEQGFDDPRVVAAVPEVVRAAWPLEPLPMPIVRLFDRVVEAAARGLIPWDAAVLYAIGRIFEFHERGEGAKAAYRQLSARGAGFHDAAARLSQLEDGLAESADGTWLPPHILASGFHEYAPRPALEDLPLLPGGNTPRARPSLATPARPDSPRPGPFQAYGGMVPDAQASGARPAPSEEFLPLPPTPPTTGQFRAQSSSASRVPPSSPGAARRAPERRNADETMGFDEYVAGGGTSGSGEMNRPVVATSSGWGGGDRSVDGSGGGDVGGSPLDPGTVHTGSIIADRYRIEDILGTGGMAVVYRATDMELEEQIALKVFLQVVQHKDGLMRFRREMKLSRKLVHPNIVRIFEFGLWRGARFITMELLKGDVLERFLKRSGGRVPPGTAMRLAMQAADGLGAAHKAGVVHRDVKPQNMFVLEEGKKLKLMDFGIAKVKDSATISATDVRVGTPRYMAPEQIQGGQEVGPAADFYSLGAVMYEMFTGQRVFDEEDLVPLLMCHLSEEPKPLRQRNPEVPASVEAIVLRLLRKKPEERFSDSADLRKALLAAFVDIERLAPR
jgi:serine/threonine-protein kinase